jgi:hypothetical protein
MAFVVAIVTWAGNVALAYAQVFPCFRFWLTHSTHSPVALGVFSASFLIVLAALLAISAQPTILQLGLFFYSASPFSRWARTRDWRPRLISWYKSRRAARVCVWIKDDDVCLRNVSLCARALIFPGPDSRHATSTAFRAKQRTGCPNGHIRPRVQKYRCDPERTAPKRASPRRSISDNNCRVSAITTCLPVLI